MYWNDGKRKVWREKGAEGIDSLLFTDDGTADRRSRMNSEVHRTMLSAHIKANATKMRGRRLTRWIMTLNIL